MDDTSCYVASTCVDTAEIRIHNSTRKPHVSIHPNTVGAKIEVRRASSAGQWICSLTCLTPGSSYSVTVNHAMVLHFRTLDDAGLGRRRLRIGILSDTHVNFRSHNGKRLYASANELMAKYAAHLVDHHGVDCLVLPGDVCDTGNAEELREVASVLSAMPVPSYPIIGNHEMDLRRFAAALTPDHPKGYYCIAAGMPNIGSVHIILLATNTQDSLNEGTAQLEWLRRDLAASRSSDIILVFMHYSLVLHSLHNDGRWDDGLQLLDNASGVLDLLHSYPSVKAVIAGHKNVPSMLVDSHGLLHTLSPQLIQVPCGYDVVDVYDKGLLRVVHEIEEMDLQNVSRRAAGKAEAKQRWGEEQHRSFVYNWE